MRLCHCGAALDYADASVIACFVCRAESRSPVLNAPFSMLLNGHVPANDYGTILGLPHRAIKLGSLVVLPECRGLFAIKELIVGNCSADLEYAAKAFGNDGEAGVPLGHLGFLRPNTYVRMTIHNLTDVPRQFKALIMGEAQ